jgi:hypothetical protein
MSNDNSDSDMRLEVEVMKRCRVCELIEMHTSKLSRSSSAKDLTTHPRTSWTMHTKDRCIACERKNFTQVVCREHAWWGKSICIDCMIHGCLMSDQHGNMIDHIPKDFPSGVCRCERLSPPVSVEKLD